LKIPEAPALLTGISAALHPACGECARCSSSWGQSIHPWQIFGICQNRLWLRAFVKCLCPTALFSKLGAKINDKMAKPLYLILT